MAKQFEKTVELSNLNTEHEFLKEEFKKLKHDLSYFILASNGSTDTRNYISLFLVFLCVAFITCTVALYIKEAYQKPEDNTLMNSEKLLNLIDKRIKLKISNVGESDSDSITVIDESSGDDKKNKKR
jgi:hypothetical protein